MEGGKRGKGMEEARVGKEGRGREKWRREVDTMQAMSSAEPDLERGGVLMGVVYYTRSNTNSRSEPPGKSRLEPPADLPPSAVVDIQA